MHASKLTVNADLLTTKKLGNIKKRKLREQILKEYIQSRPYGAPITLEDFKKAGRWNTDSAPHAFITRMLKEGQITREKIPGTLKYSYVVSGVVKVIKTSNADTIIKVETLAKEYAWTEESDSLRGFIKFLNQRGAI